jgi:hypothetical protein
MAIQTADVIMPGNDNAFETGRRGQISSIAELDESYRWLLEKNVYSHAGHDEAKRLAPADADLASS